MIQELNIGIVSSIFFICDAATTSCAKPIVESSSSIAGRIAIHHAVTKPSENTVISPAAMMYWHRSAAVMMSDATVSVLLTEIALWPCLPSQRLVVRDLVLVAFHAV